MLIVFYTGHNRRAYIFAPDDIDLLFADKYIKEIQTRSAIPENEPFIEKETVSTALVNGNNALGCAVGNFAMSIAIKKAQETGVGWVAANNSNHYGIAGMYSIQAVNQGLLVIIYC